MLAALQIGWGCLLIGCTDSNTNESPGEPLHVVGMTRSGDETDVSDPIGQSVKLFLDNGNTISSDAVTYQGKTASTTTSLRVKPGADYQVFGFMPSDANGTNGSSSVTINSNTAILTIENLAPLSTDDVCVVIGVKGKLAPNEKVVAGSFKYHAPENTEEGFGVSLLVDHLFAAMDFNLSVDATYDAIRTIKLKKVVMKSTSAQKVTAVITLTMNNNGTNPITNIEFTPSGTAQDELILYQSENEQGTALDVTTPIEFTGFYGAGISSLGSTLSIESTYDIYDKDGNLIDKDRKAVNNLATVLTNITRGKKVKLNMKVIPTYLYVLSDSDAEFVQVIE
jgi:hypothetical protein